MIIDGKQIQVFACAAGTGKTTLSRMNSDFVDVDREKYFCKYPELDRSLSDREIENIKDLVMKKNKEFPENFFTQIQNWLDDGKNLLVVPEPLIMEFINKNNLPYILIYPEANCKQIYKNNMLNRGNSVEFTNWFNMFFDKYLSDHENDTKAFKKIKLRKGEYLSDVINSLK